MKEFYALTLVLVTLSSFTANAKQGRNPDADGIRNPLSTGQKATGTAQRYLAQSDYESNGTVLTAYDSGTYTYVNTTSTNLSVYNDYVPSGSAWAPYYRETHTYDGSNYLTQQTIDNWNAGTSAYDKSQQTSYINNAAGYPTDLVVKYWDAPTTAYVNSQHQIVARNAASFITDLIIQQWKSGAWRNYRHVANTLNAQNNITSSIQQNWDTAANVWVNKTKTSSVYDASGLHMSSDTVLTWNSSTSTWKNNFVDIAYLNGAGLADSSLRKTWSTAGSGSYINSQLDYYTYDGSGYETSDITQYYIGGTWSNDSKRLYTYNSAGQLASQSTLMWDGSIFGTGSGASRITYYFETYTPTGVVAQSSRNMLLALSPNPVSNILSISLQWSTAQDFTAMMLDMQGRIYQQFSGTNVKEFTKHISVADMPGGNYLLSVKGADGSSLARMITVLH